MATTRRRRRRSRSRSFMQHLPAIICLVAIVGLIVWIIAFKPFDGLLSGNENDQSVLAPSTVTAGETGTVTLDGSRIGVFDSQQDAETHKVTVNAEAKSMTISTTENVDVSVSVDGRSANNVLTKSGNGYTLDLEGFGHESVVVVKMSIGGDGSLLGKRFGNAGIETKYFALSINNPTVAQEQSITTLGVPTGVVYFDGSAYQTYGSEVEAHNAMVTERNRFTIPTYMVTNGIEVRAEPGENTARMQVRVCMVDSNDFDTRFVYLNSSTNWTGTLDVSQFAGHQIILMINSMNTTGISNGYSYVSIFVPEVFQFEETEENIEDEDFEEEGFG